MCPIEGEFKNRTRGQAEVEFTKGTFTFSNGGKKAAFTINSSNKQVEIKEDDTLIRISRDNKGGAAVVALKGDFPFSLRAEETSSTKTGKMPSDVYFLESNGETINRRIPIGKICTYWSEGLFELTINNEIKNQYPPLDAVVILGAFALWDKTTGKWRYPTINKNDPGKIQAFRARVIAASLIYKYDIAPKLLITGGAENIDGRKVSRAKIFADYLTDRYKVPREFIQTIGEKDNTKGNIQDAVEYIQCNPDTFPLMSIGILSNKFHLARAYSIIFYNKFLREMGFEITMIPAEDLLKQESPHLRSWVERVDRLPEMRTRTRLEKKGTKAFVKEIWRPFIRKLWR